MEINWHERYTQQARWTRDLRAYLFEKARLSRGQCILEVGCGTGAILSELTTDASLHGLDLDPAALAECRIHVPYVSLVRGDGLSLPYLGEAFDIVYCHYFLLWVRDPVQAVQEMKRVTRKSGHVLALAEPDYSARVDKPDELAMLGQWQTESLKQQGADPSFGARLAETFFQAGIQIIETGAIRSAGRDPSPREREMEWAVMESDLAGFVAGEELHKLQLLDERAWKQGERILRVPTYFCLGQA